MAKSRTPKAGRRGISRIDQDSTRTHGWFVRVGYYETRKGSYRARHTKFFGDVSYGGKRKALRSAEAFVALVERRKIKRPKSGRAVKGMKRAA
jgi:hypothetical protein